MKTHHALRVPALALVLVFGSLGAAQAQGAYFGASLGQPDYRDTVNGIGGDDGGTTGKLFLGYQFSPALALEGGLFDLGHTDSALGRAKVRGAFLDGVGTWGFSPKWAAIGRIGVARGKFRTSLGDDSSGAVKLGAGLQYDLSDTIALRGEYARYRFSGAFGSKANVGELSFGVKISY